MQYLLLIYPDGARERFEQLSEERQEAIAAEYLELARADGMLGGAQLQPAETATTVRVNGNGEALTTDGPFATTKEGLGGYFLLEADDLDAALEIAARVPVARMGGAVEVRPLVER